MAYRIGWVKDASVNEKPGIAGFFTVLSVDHSGMMFAACLPLGPVATSNVTR
jgi:hypothetical protein